jgi:hypothetical protein
MPDEWLTNDKIGWLTVARSWRHAALRESRSCEEPIDYQILRRWAACRGRKNAHELEFVMPQFDPELIQVMRSALEDVMARVPVEYSTVEVKARLAEYILKVAAQGQTNYDALVASATSQIHVIQSLFS